MPYRPCLTGHALQAMPYRPCLTGHAMPYRPCHALQAMPYRPCLTGHALQAMPYRPASLLPCFQRSREAGHSIKHIIDIKRKEPRRFLKEKIFKRFD